jgi:hypothetical protein
MVEHLFADFLDDEQVYRSAERYWVDLWEGIDSEIRRGWKQPWFQPLPPSLGEGNPIFSAVSPRLRRGIRIIQSAPTDKRLEFVAYPDTFGGSVFDLRAIHELVISCALSDAVARVALSLMLPWVAGQAVDVEAHEAGLVTYDDQIGENVFVEWDLVSPATWRASGYREEERIFPGRYAA